jgi:hypothetical protein
MKGINDLSVEHVPGMLFPAELSADILQRVYINLLFTDSAAFEVSDQETTFW